MKIFWIAALSLCIGLVTGCASEPLSGKLRFDGVYQGSEQIANDGKTHFRQYLRFFSDGKVIVVGSMATPAQLKTWFNLGHPSVMSGTARLQGNSLRIEATGNGNMQMSAQVSDDKIVPDSAFWSGGPYIFIPW